MTIWSLVREKRSRGRSGFTLIEGMIAIGIISTAMIVGLTLAISNLTAAQDNSDRIASGHLAREGVEAVRNIRDSNWLKRYKNVDKDPASAATTQFFAWDDFFNGWPLIATPTYGNYFDIKLNRGFSYGNGEGLYSLMIAPQQADAFSCLAFVQHQCEVWFDGNQHYQDLTPAVGSQSRFYRRIRLQPVCWDGTKEYVNGLASIGCVNVGDQKIGVLVTSQVVWRRGPKTLLTEAKEKIYNWRSL